VAAVAGARGAKAVHVDHGHGQRATMAARALDLFVQASLEGGKRKQAGERLSHGAHLELALQLDDALAGGGKLALGLLLALAVAQHGASLVDTRA